MKKGIFIALGGNIGDRKAYLNKGLTLLAQKGVSIVQCSDFLETEAWGNTNQPPFLNAVAQIETNLAPVALMHVLLQTETECGRIRTEKWSPRTLDLDLLAFHQLIFEHPDLILPHPFLHERNFVLAPFAQIAPDFFIPKVGERVGELYGVCKE